MVERWMLNWCLRSGCVRQWNRRCTTRVYKVKEKIQKQDNTLGSKPEKTNMNRGLGTSELNEYFTKWSIQWGCLYVCVQVIESRRVIGISNRVTVNVTLSMACGCCNPRCPCLYAEVHCGKWTSVHILVLTWQEEGCRTHS